MSAVASILRTMPSPAKPRGHFAFGERARGRNPWLTLSSQSRRPRYGRSGKHSRLHVSLDPLIRRQGSVANDSANRDDRRRETQQPNRNPTILAFAFG
jgi:hypothetical protein